MSKKTLIIGASTNTVRYSYLATSKLRRYKHEVVAIGSKEGTIMDVKIYTDRPNFENIHTVAMYINPKIQKEYYDYILGLKPKRIIFNPGTENYELYALARKNNIEAINACALVLLATKEY